MARVLELSSLRPLATLALDGKDYDLVNPLQWGILEHFDFEELRRRAEELKAGPHTRESLQELVALMDKLCRMVWRAPSDVHERLSDSQKQLVVSAFTELLRGRLPASAEANEEPVKAAGETALPQTSIGVSS